MIEDGQSERCRVALALTASAGGVEALTTVIGGLPPSLPAAVLVVLHVAPIGPSVLPAIIERHGSLPATHPEDGEILEAGRVYVAPPDHHLLVSDDSVQIVRGPRENGNRPAADPLFRSIASCFGPRAAGVVLSGALDDGTAGLAAIKAAGGFTVVQDPEEAAFPGMPMSAVTYANPDLVLKLQEIPPILAKFAEEASQMSPKEPRPESTKTERYAEPPSEFTCPECGGTLWAESDEPLRFRCRVGHSFSSDGLTLGKRDAIENAIWAAIVALEERADLTRRLLKRLGPEHRVSLSHRYEAVIEQSKRGAATLKELATELVGPIAEADGGEQDPNRVGG